MTRRMVLEREGLPLVVYLGASADRVRELELAGFSVVSRDGPDSIAGDDAALVILDLDPTSAARVDLPARLRERAGNAPPVLAMVDRLDPRPISQLLDSGIEDFVSKPFAPGELIRRVHHLQRAIETRTVARRDDARLSRARRMARLASWELSLESGEFRADDELLEIFECGRARDAAQIDEMIERVHPGDRARVAETWASRRPHLIEYRIVVERARRETRMIQQEAELAQDVANGEVRLLGTIQDITALKEAERKVSRLAYYDSLTGLPNRAFLREHLSRVLANAKRYGYGLAVMGVDLDLFKRINDTMGHAAGDALLREVAGRLNGAVREGDAVVSAGAGDAEVAGDAVVRLGGDEFIIILSHLKSPDGAAVVARRVAEHVSRPAIIEGTEVFVGCSIGIALYPENGTTPGELLKHADAAMYHAKERGRNNYQFFTPALNQRAERRMMLENGIRAGLARGDFRVHFQPKVEMSTGRIVGAEALVRWPAAQGGFVSPGEFIPIAEDAGLIVPLGELVLRTSCAQAKAWLDRGWRVPIAVNVSGRQFGDGTLADTIAGILHTAELPPELLEVEITEGVIMKDAGEGIAVLERLRALGVRIALDDFGTGYSSLSYLSRFPIDVLKIDRSFVKDLPGEATSSAVTTSIIALARSLSLDVVAEGVETREQIDFLLRQGCRTCQGFFFSPAVSADDFESKLAAGTLAKAV